MMHSLRALNLALLVGLVTACHEAPSQETVAVTRPPAPPAPSTAAPGSPPSAPPALPCPLPVYQLEELGKQLVGKARLSPAAVKQWLQRYPRLPRWFGDYGDGQDLRVVDTLKCPGYTLVTMFYEHEDCCEDLYYVTYTPDRSALVGWQRVAQRGADGFWQAESRLRRDADGRLVVTHLADNQEDEGSAYYRDSVVTRYELTPAGRWARVRLDSARTNHTRREP